MTIAEGLGCSVHPHYAMCLEKDRKEKEETRKQLTLQREQALQLSGSTEMTTQQRKSHIDLQCEEKESEGKLGIPS